ncbi:MAG: hypothetical protein HOH66_01565 [Rhodospirillaceae bacterium]|nr:hypothetical protein [Rhodospirillaceae bacterium]MBT6116538.1 hypothetical protein [Rhodospirillaceae bacterium]
MGRKAALATGLGAAAVALVLLGQGVPRLIAAAYTAPYDQTLRDLGDARHPRDISPGELSEAAESRRQALAWHDSARTRTEFGAARMMQASRDDYEGTRGRILLDQSIEAHRDALARRPADSHTWTRLARLLLVRDGLTPGIVPYLRMAIRTAPSDPRLIFARLDLAFMAWPMMDNTTRALIAEQIRIAARTKTKAFARLVKERFALEIAREALKDDIGLQRRFDAYYSHL